MAQGQPSASDVGQELLDQRRRMTQDKAAWLARLVEFDRGGWCIDDGHLTTVDWLVDRCGLARTTAKEKLRVARELSRRPVLSHAFADGRISYSKLRPLTRITDGDDELDEALLAAALDHTAAVMERLYRYWDTRRNEHRPPSDLDRWERRGIMRIDRLDGLAEVRVITLAEDAERLMTLLDTDARSTRRTPEAGDGASAEASGTPDVGGPVDDGTHAAAKGAGEASAEASQTSAINESDDQGRRRTAEPPVEASAEASGIGELAYATPGGIHPNRIVTWSQRRADALVDLVEVAVAALDEAKVIDPSRVLAHVMVDYDALVARTGGGLVELGGGQPLTGEAARRLACDASITRIITRGRSEILDVGRVTRQWSEPQRRAIRARFGGRCCVGACARRITEIHHCDPWGAGGCTNLDVGIPVCFGHHHLLHEGGWSASYDPVTGVVTFESPTGQTLTSPTRFDVTLAG